MLASFLLQNFKLFANLNELNLISFPNKRFNQPTSVW